MRTILFFLYRSRCNFVFCTAVLLSVMLTVTGALWASTTPHIACGYTHSLALKSDGTVWAWGYNTHGQLGDGNYEEEYFRVPVQCSGLSGVITIACGEEHSIALKSDGTVWTWGDNEYGQLGLGDGTYTDKYTPAQVNDLSGVTAIAGGEPQTLALKSDGTVWESGWGSDQLRQISDFNLNTNTTPTPIYSPTPTASLTTMPTPPPAPTLPPLPTPTPSISPLPTPVPSPSLSKYGRISGYVYNMRGYPIESAKIRLKKANSRVLKKTFSDEDGFFEFTDLDADTYIVTALKSGHKTVKQTVTLEEGEEVDIEIVVKKTKRK